MRVRHVGRTIWLLVLWLALWGTVTPANVLSGVLVAGLVQLLPDPYHAGGQFAVRPWHALTFFVYVGYKLVQANLVVALEVVTRRDRIKTGVVAVPLEGVSDALVTLVANTIGLTPGSITVEVQHEPPTLFVHALHVTSVEAVRADIRKLEVMAIKAFGGPEAVSGLHRDDSRATTTDLDVPHPHAHHSREAGS